MLLRMADDWRTRLKALIDERPDVDMKNLSLRAGLGETGVRDLLKRHGNPKLETVKAVLRELNLPLSFLEEAGGQIVRQPSLVPVVGEAAAGVWVEQDIWDDAKYEDVPSVPHRYAHIEQQKAWKISGPSMNRLKIDDGDFVITVPYWMVRTMPQDDDVVIVQRTKGAVVETTCKQVEVKRDVVQLHPRSTDPRYQTPYEIPRAARTVEHTVPDDRIEIVGLVIGKYLPM